jgi:hypothetical protein
MGRRLLEEFVLGVYSLLLLRRQHRILQRKILDAVWMGTEGLNCLLCDDFLEAISGLSE